MMKKMTAIILAFLMIFSLVACGSRQEATDNTPSASSQTESSSDAGSVADSSGEGTEQEGASQTPSGTNEGNGEANGQAEAANGNILIAYFSVPETDGVDTVSGASRVVVDGEVLGNNQYIARLIQQEVGGDLFRIETVQEYPGSHDALLEFAYNELDDNARPELATQIENFDSYDIVFLGYPNWNADLPMPLYTFLEQYDFSGKTIVPFTVHGGSGFSRTIQTIEDLEPEAIVVGDGLSISRNSVSEAQSNVAEWIDGLNIL